MTRSTFWLSMTAGALVIGGCGGSTSPGGVADAATDGSAIDASGDAGGDGSSSCSPACGTGRTCCEGRCVNLVNDPTNCGHCGTTCSGATPFCQNECKAAPCERDGGSCGNGGSCCGTQCCAAGQICCDAEGPISGAPICFTPTADQSSCPQGCAPLCVSDRDAKRAVSAVDDRAVLDALAGVPISTWSYKDDRSGARHLGPMAQDLTGAFGLSGDGRTYDPVDAHGIAFASIKALYAMVTEQNERIERLESENARLRATRSGNTAICR